MNEYASRKMLRIKLGGCEFTFRPSSLRRLLANNQLSPAMYEAVTAKNEGVDIPAHDVLVARVADIRAFESLLISDCSVSPKIVDMEPDADSDAVWIELFNEQERGALLNALSEYNNCEPDDFEVIAPFRHAPHDDDASGAVSDNAIGLGG